MSERSRHLSGRPTPTEAILVVEPDVLVRMAISDYLRACGYMIIEARDSNEALKVLRAGFKVDAVFSATNLGADMSGFELAQHVRANYPGIEILLASSVAMAAKKAGDLCDEGPIEKPYHHDVVAKRLKLMLQREKTQKPR